MCAGRLRSCLALVQAKRVDEQGASPPFCSCTGRRRAHQVRSYRRRGRWGAGMGVGCTVVLAGSWARRKRLWARSRDRPSSCAPGRRQTSLGAIDAFASSCARWCAAHLDGARCRVRAPLRLCARPTLTVCWYSFAAGPPLAMHKPQGMLLAQLVIFKAWHRRCCAAGSGPHCRWAASPVRGYSCDLCVPYGIQRVGLACGLACASLVSITPVFGWRR